MKKKKVVCRLNKIDAFFFFFFLVASTSFLGDRLNGDNCILTTRSSERRSHVAYFAKETLWRDLIIVWKHVALDVVARLQAWRCRVINVCLKVLCEQLHLALLPVQILFAPLSRLGTTHHNFFLSVWV